ncbi:MAG: lipopolysaccharide biosynthesis protein [Christensenellales bacterium]|jgi:O-antigen/teichoic acid export membrane protein
MFNRVKTIVKDGFLHIFAGTFLNKAVAMISSVVVARLVSKDSFAHFSYSETIYGYFILFLGMGVSGSLLKYCSGDSYSQKDFQYLRYAIKAGGIFEFSVILLVVPILLFVELPFEESKRFIVINSLYPLIYFFYDLLINFLRAKRKNVLYARLGVTFSVLVSLFSILFVHLFDAIGLVFARYLVLILISVLLVSYTLKTFHFDRNTGCELTKLERKEFVVMGISLMVANAFSGMIALNENMLISHIISDEVQLSNFRIAGLFPQLLLLITQAVNVYFFPIIANMDNRGFNVRKKTINIGLFNFLLVTLAVFAGIIMTPWLITVFYGQKYADAIPIAYMLWLMRGANAAIRMVPMNMLIAIGQHRFNMIMSITAFILQLALDWLLMVRYGILGLVYGTIAVYTITGIIYWWRFLYVTKEKGGTAT